jgi:DNA-binding protein, YbaB/EbfC family
MFGLDIMKKVQEMQANMAQLQEELGSKVLTGSSGGGMVTVTCNGRQELLSVSIDKSMLDDSDSTMLEDLVLTAVNDALKQSRDLMGDEMRALTGGISIPGIS